VAIRPADAENVIGLVDAARFGPDTKFDPRDDADLGSLDDLGVSVHASITQDNLEAALSGDGDDAPHVILIPGRLLDLDDYAGTIADAVTNGKRVEFRVQGD
jgi:hypothetical protein